MYVCACGGISQHDVACASDDNCSPKCTSLSCDATVDAKDDDGSASSDVDASVTGTTWLLTHDVVDAQFSQALSSIVRDQASSGGGVRGFTGNRIG